MSTTLLFAELLIIGLQASLWLFLLSLAIFGFNWLQSLFAIGLADWQTVIVVISLSIVYAIGIIVDRIADLIFSPLDRKIRQRLMPSTRFPLSSAIMRFRLGKDNEYLNRQFEYTRSRIRISRASIINFALCTSIGLWLISQAQFANFQDKSKYVFVVLISGIVLTISASYTWLKLTRTYQGLIKANWELYIDSLDSVRKSPIKEIVQRSEPKGVRKWIKEAEIEE